MRGKGKRLSALQKVGYRNEPSRFHLALFSSLTFNQAQLNRQANPLQPVERQRRGRRTGTAVPGFGACQPPVLTMLQGDRF